MIFIRQSVLSNPDSRVEDYEHILSQLLTQMIKITIIPSDLIQVGIILRIRVPAWYRQKVTPYEHVKVTAALSSLT